MTCPANPGPPSTGLMLPPVAEETASPHSTPHLARWLGRPAVLSVPVGRIANPSGLRARTDWQSVLRGEDFLPLALSRQGLHFPLGQLRVEDTADQERPAW